MLDRWRGIVERDKLVEKGLLRCQDYESLRIYTYNDRCVHEKAWNNITLNSRGHIFDRQTGKCIACPFPKFFNLEERPDTQPNVLPWSSGFRVFEKMDGWLGTLYWYKGEYRIATRGSFESPGAQWATEYLRRNHGGLVCPPETTLIFEIISPETHIIVDYDFEDLVVIGAFDYVTGEELGWSGVEAIAKCNGFRVPKVYKVSELKQIFQHNKAFSGKENEGVVVRFNNGQRVKIKSRDYLRRARILSRLTPLSVWETMENGRVPEQYIDAVDADYQAQIIEYALELQRQHEEWLDNLREEYDRFKHIESRKDFAIAIRGSGYASMMFCLRDGRMDRVHDSIKEMIRPRNNVLQEMDA